MIPVTFLKAMRQTFCYSIHVRFAMHRSWVKTVITGVCTLYVELQKYGGESDISFHEFGRKGLSCLKKIKYEE